MRSPVLAAAVTLGLSGCAAIAARSTTTSGSRSPVAVAERTHEYPAPVPAAERAPGSPSAAAAVFAFANGYINWNAHTVVADLRWLAADSVGQARSAMQIEAAQVAADYELRGGGVANAGTVEAVALLRGSKDDYVVVTQESTTATATDAYRGLRPAWHVTIATVRREPSGAWVLSGWQPES
jgi:type IV pilus biogenesis protein CpaD/CtpE